MRRFASTGERLNLGPNALLGLVLIVVGSVIWLVGFGIGTGKLSHLFGGPEQTIRADFASIEQIVPGDPVRIHGVKVGKVAKSTLMPDRRGATLKLDLDTKQPIYADASAAIKWRTVLGANEMVEIDPGTRAAGPLGSRTIPLSQTSNQVELDEVTQSLQPGARSGMRTMIQQLGPALRQPQPLAQGLSTLARVAPDVKTGVGAVRGEVPDADLRNLVRNSSRAAEALDVGTGADETRRFASSAATTLQAVSTDPADLRAAIDSAAALMPTLARSAPALNSSLDLLDPLVAKLTPEAPRVSRTLAAVRPAVAHTDALLQDARPLLHRLDPTVRSLARAADVGAPLVDNLNPSLKRIADEILPSLAKRYPEQGGRTVYEELGSSVFANLGSAAGYFDASGELANLTASLGQMQSIDVLPCRANFSGTNLLVCNSLSDALQEFMTGGTSLLGGLVKKPGGAPIYGPLLRTAQRLAARREATQRALLKKAPAVARFLFKPHGAGK